jgi:prepilin peptidase CpaA
MPFVEALSWFIFSGLLIWAALSDGRTLTIPNRLCLAVALLYIARLPVLGPTEWAVGLLIGMGGLAGGFLAFNRGLIGGGDAKLIAAVLPWAGSADAGAFLLITALAGGVLALVILIRHRGPALIRTVTGRVFLSEPRGSAELALPGLPYGIAIAAGGLWIAVRAVFGTSTGL